MSFTIKNAHIVQWQCVKKLNNVVGCRQRLSCIFIWVEIAITVKESTLILLNET